MGNVLAASGPTNPAGASFGVPDPAKPTGAGPLPSLDKFEPLKENKPLDNPGSVEELHKKYKDIQAMPFEGAKIMLNKGLSNHFQVSHTINLLQTQPSSYRFGATYVGTNSPSSSEAYPVLLGDIDPSGNLNANIIHQLSPRIRCKFGSQIQDSKMTAGQLSTDYRGDEFTASLTVANPNIFNNSGVMVGQFLQALTPQVALGAEVAYQYGPNVPGSHITVVSALGRYTAGDSVWSGTIGAGGVHLCYYQKASDQLQIGVELETSLRMQESIATIGYQVDLPKADLIFRGAVDTQWTVSGVLEKRLTPLPFSFALSGRLNHDKSQFRLGCGLIIG